jgi:putative component of toxin-antitoxin plasmid stabilization module
LDTILPVAYLVTGDKGTQDADIRRARKIAEEIER